MGRAIFDLRATAVAYVLESLILAFVVHRFVDVFRRDIRILRVDPSAHISPLDGLGRGYTALFGLVEILGLGRHRILHSSGELVVPVPVAVGPASERASRTKHGRLVVGVHTVAGSDERRRPGGYGLLDLGRGDRRYRRSGGADIGRVLRSTSRRRRRSGPRRPGSLTLEALCA